MSTPTPAPSSHPANKARKCLRLFIALEAARFSPEDAAQLTDWQWQETARCAGVGYEKPPSEDTRQLVIEALRFAEGITDRKVPRVGGAR